MKREQLKALYCRPFLLLSRKMHLGVYENRALQ